MRVIIIKLSRGRSELNYFTISLLKKWFILSSVRYYKVLVGGSDPLYSIV